MQIEFSIPYNPGEWLDTVARQFGATIDNNSFEVPRQVGEGTFRQIYFFEGLTLTYLRFKLFEPSKFIRRAARHGQMVPIMFYSQDIPLEQNIDKQKKQVGYHTSNGIFVSSTQVPSTWIVPPVNWGYLVILTMEKNWFLQSCNYSGNIRLCRLLKSGKPFFIFESLTSSMKQIISSIHALINSEDKLQYLKLHHKAMELLNLLLENVEQAPTGRNILNLNASDVNAIFQARKQLLDNLAHIPSLKQLSLAAGMSISKLQKCFRQVFGKSISQYALSEKMNLAKQLLDSKKYAVSEVGYQIGYSNLSHFSKAFKKEFGVNPKSYLNTRP